MGFLEITVKVLAITIREKLSYWEEGTEQNEDGSTKKRLIIEGISILEDV